MQNVLQAQYAQYRSAQDSIDLINKKYHDLKHQIAVLRSETSEEKAHYLDAMEQEIRSYEAQNKTGNEVLDTILTSKSLYCQQHGITLTCVADGAALDFMDTMDLCSLFGNALDNAIESVEKLPDSEQRLIHLVVARQKSFLWIRVENTYDGAFQADGTLPKTTKTDARYHGYGLKSIYDTAEKYGGTAEISTQEKCFTLKVLLPVQQNKPQPADLAGCFCVFGDLHKDPGGSFVNYDTPQNCLRCKKHGLRMEHSFKTNLVLH